MKQSSSELPLWREGCEQQRAPRFYGFNSNGSVPPRGVRSHLAGLPRRIELDRDGRLAELMAPGAPLPTIIEELVGALCRVSGAACGVSFLDHGRNRLIAGPERLRHFWRAYAGTDLTSKFRRARCRGEFEFPCRTSLLGERADAVELQLLTEAIGFRSFQAIPLGGRRHTREPRVLELFHDDPDGPSTEQIAEIQTAARIAELAFARSI